PAAVCNAERERRYRQEKRRVRVGRRRRELDRQPELGPHVLYDTKERRVALQPARGPPALLLDPDRQRRFDREPLELMEEAVDRLLVERADLDVEACLRSDRVDGAAACDDADVDWGLRC